MVACSDGLNARLEVANGPLLNSSENSGGPLGIAQETCGKTLAADECWAVNQEEVDPKEGLCMTNGGASSGPSARYVQRQLV